MTTIAPVDKTTPAPRLQPTAPAPPARNDHDGDDGGGVRPAPDKGTGQAVDTTA